MSFHLYTEHFIFLQIYHIAVDNAVFFFFKRDAPRERAAICDIFVSNQRPSWFVYDLTKQVGGT